MGILRRVKHDIKKTGGLLMLPYMYYRAKHPKEMAMSAAEAAQVLKNAPMPRGEAPFRGAAVPGEDLYDLSIVIPVYNGEAYLKDCLDSILNQETRFSFEVICVNDGSKDQSLRILEDYRVSDARVKVLDQENQGISTARNNGLALARGKYVMLIDNDDMLEKGAIETVLDNAFRHDADIVKTGHQVFTTSRTINVIESGHQVYTDGLGKGLLRYNGFVWGSAIRRSLFEKVCFPVGFWYEDMITRLLLYRMCRRFVYVDSTFYRYRMHGNNASKKVWSARNYKALDQYYLLDEIRKYAAWLGLEEDRWVYGLYLSECGDLLHSRLKDLDPETKQAAFSACGDLLRDAAETCDLSGLPTISYMLMRSLVCRDYKLWDMLCRSSIL